MPIVKIEEAQHLALDWLTATALGFEPEREGYWDVEQERSVITKLHYQGAEMVDTLKLMTNCLKASNENYQSL